MRTLGIDLAAEPTRTAACLIEWHPGQAVVQDLLTGCDDQKLLMMIGEADRVGIAAPFGWPDAFINAITLHHSFGRWPGPDRKSLRFRASDRFVTDLTGLWPLSVSTDRIGVTAMRCAYLLDQLKQGGVPVDRSGVGKIMEVYPAAALKIWDFDPRRYKQTVGRENLLLLVKSLVDGRPWLTLPEKTRRRCEESDDAFDALIASFVTRAVAVGRTHMPAPEQVEQVTREGWIHMPTFRDVNELVRV